MVLDLRQRRVMGLNPAASLLWASADGRRSVGQLAELVAARFKVSAQVSRKDTLAFFKTMAARGLVELGVSEPRSKP